MSDWQVGDSAVCISIDSICGECQIVTGRQPTIGSVYTVSAIEPDDNGGFGFELVELPDDDWLWCPCAFRKIRPDKHEPCETEFKTLLKRKRVSA